jgi:uncharacterized protein YbcI
MVQGSLLEPSLPLFSHATRDLRGGRESVMEATAKGFASGEMLAAIANLVVGTYADHTGRGPTKARAYVHEDLVVVLMEDTMTKAERKLIESGHEATVLETRAMFQEAMREGLVAGVEELLGRPVRACIGGNSLRPDMASVLFIVEGVGGV